MVSLIFITSSLLVGVCAQHPGHTPEIHPKLTTWRCTTRHGCIPQQNAVTLDALKRSLYQVNDPSYDCGTGHTTPNATACPDVETCQKNCVMEGITDYSTVGVRTEGGSLYLDQLRDSDLTKLSPRVYLLSEDEHSYEMLQVAGQEFTFDVDVSKLPCGMNGALYFSEMEKHGGQSKLNTGGPAYGTGYCDAQCYVTPFIDGEGNIDGYGACCNEMDIWEANARSNQLAPHACNITSLYKCEGAECTSTGVCDKSGCGYNPYAIGDHNYYGEDKVVDTTRPFTVVTQFPTDANGALQEIRRLYIQDGQVIQNAATNVSSLPSMNYIDDEYCQAAKATNYLRLGGTEEMGNALARGMVLAMSIWWDESGGNMSWLDMNSAGPCNATEGSPASIEKIEPDTSVTFSNIKWGEINSTFRGGHGQY